MYRLFANTLLFSPIHLPLIMFPYTSHCLLQSSCAPMQMIWMGCFMLMKYHTVPFCRIICIMQIPVMSGISGLYRHIMLTQKNDVEILGTDFIKLSCIKHLHPPLWKTMKPMPVPEHSISFLYPQTALYQIPVSLLLLPSGYSSLYPLSENLLHYAVPQPEHF